MENNTMTPKAVAKEIVDRIQESVNEQDNPKNRIVTDIWVTENGSTFKDVYIRSNCDGFAEREIRVTTTCNPKIHTEYFYSTPWKLLNSCVGDTEESVVTDIGAIVSSKKEVECAAHRVYLNDDPEGLLLVMIEDYITRLVRKRREIEPFIEFIADIGDFKVDIEEFLNKRNTMYVAKLFYVGNSFGNLLIDPTK